MKRLMIWYGEKVFFTSFMNMDLMEIFHKCIFERILQVRVGGSLSETFYVENGLPQGSVISPIFFLVAINNVAPANVKYSLFADDAAI